MPINTSSFLSSARNIASTAASTIGTVNNAVNTLKTQGFGAALRSINLLPGGETGNSFGSTSATFSSTSKDWRVRLSLPNNPAYTSSGLIRPLMATNGLVFPYTPAIQVLHSASYQSMAPMHNNYPFLAYENSKIDALTITAPFYCEDANDAAYWVAVMHFLKSVTKMSMGKDVNAGAPPPILKLNGYGDYVFKDVPVVVTSFTMDLPNDADYISCGLTAGAASTESILGTIKSAFSPLASPQAQSVTWAPVKSTISVTVQPLYSRQQVRSFSLDGFIKGEYITGSGGNKTGFI
jgi:hypothetical protein